jgi:putative peptide zinc metalloprotease protein
MSGRKSRLELLVRAPGDQGFEVREIPSALAYLQHRPQRLPDGEWELATLHANPRRGPTFVLKSRRRDRYLQLSEPEKFLWERMDGQTSLQELGTAYVLRYGAFDFELIPRLIRRLQQAELLTMRPVSRLREVLARNRGNAAVRAAEATLRALDRLTVTSRRAHDTFRRVYRYGAFLLFTPPAAVVLAVITALGVQGALRLWADTGEISATLAAHPLVSILLVKLFFWLTVIGHQIVHALALVHYGRRVREFGFTMLHGFIPTFYADVTDIFMGSRRARIVTALSGPLVHLFLGAFYLWVASLLGPGLLKAFLAASAVLQLQSLFVSLYPFCFLEMDGYHILVDLIGIPALNHESTRFVRHVLWRRLRRRRGLNRQEWLYVAYFSLSALSIAAFVAANAWLLIHAGTS